MALTVIYLSIYLLINWELGIGNWELGIGHWALEQKTNKKQQLTANSQLSTVNCQLSTVNCQLSINPYQRLILALLVAVRFLGPHSQNIAVQVDVFPGRNIPAKIFSHAALLQFFPLIFVAETFPSSDHAGEQVEGFVAIKQ